MCRNCDLRNARPGGLLGIKTEKDRVLAHAAAGIEQLRWMTTRVVGDRALNPGDRSALDFIADAVYQAQLADSILCATVRHARDQGASWASIGEVLGVSKQAAQKRFDPSTATTKVVAAESGDGLF